MQFWLNQQKSRRMRSLVLVHKKDRIVHEKATESERIDWNRG